MKFKKAMLASASALVLAAGVSHMSAASAAELTSGHYEVEPGHTQVVFKLNHFGFTDYTGIFSGAAGTLDVDANNPSASKVNITIDVASVLTTSTKLDEELKGADWFDASKYPQAKFVSTSVKSINDKEATVTGNLTLHGVTKPVALTVRFQGAGVNPLDKADTVGFSATTTIKRSDFGVKQYVPMVGDEVQLVIAGAFEKK